jgi:Recombination endonuclease VII
MAKLNSCKNKEQFCIQGHDTYVVGRYDSNGQCRECGRVSSKINARIAHRTHPKYAKNANLKYTYGITLETYTKILLDQDGKCASCGRTNPNFNRAFSVDHDHSCCPGRRSCGKCVRGLLCSACNTILGHAKDDKKMLLKLIDYLNRKAISR